MADVAVTERSGTTFTVRISAPGDVTTHVIDASDGNAVVASLGEVDREALVLESIRFLLEHEPGSSILRSFRLDDITRYFPHYPAEIGRRL